MFAIKTIVELSKNRVQCVLTSALEGGSNDWYVIKRYEYAPHLMREDFSYAGKMQDPDEYWHPSELVPFVPECSVVFSDMNNQNPDAEFKLNLDTIRTGLGIMALNYPKHFTDMIMENDDAVTGDCFLQCCLFGDWIYS